MKRLCTFLIVGNFCVSGFCMDAAGQEIAKADILMFDSVSMLFSAIEAASNSHETSSLMTKFKEDNSEDFKELCETVVLKDGFFDYARSIGISPAKIWMMRSICESEEGK